MSLTNHPRKHVDTSDVQLEPTAIVDRWHRCEVCGDILEVGTIGLEATIGLVHECCEDEARLALSDPQRLPAHRRGQ